MRSIDLDRKTSQIQVFPGEKSISQSTSESCTSHLKIQPTGTATETHLKGSVTSSGRSCSDFTSEVSPPAGLGLDAALPSPGPR